MSSTLEASCIVWKFYTGLHMESLTSRNLLDVLRLIVDFIAQALGLPFLQSIGSDFRHGANFANAASTFIPPTYSFSISGLSPFYLGIQLRQMEQFKARVGDLFNQQKIRFGHGRRLSYECPSGPYLPSSDIFGKSICTLYIGQNDFTSKLAYSGVHALTYYIHQIISQIDATIKETLTQTKGSLKGASLVYVGTHSILLKLLQHPISHGLKYGTKACCGNGGGDYNFDPKIMCGNLATSACDEPQNYVSWDGIHLTEAANKIVSKAILNGSIFYPPFPLHKHCDLQPID